MDSGRLIFDPAPSRHHRGGHMLFLGSGGGSSIFQGARSVFGMEEGSNKRRLPFFTSPEDLYEEEYYDEQLQEKKRRLTPEQVHMLEQSFEAENKLEPDQKSELAKKLGLQPRQVAVWFQNRRARWKTKQLERDYDVLKASYDALLADHDAILKCNDRLQSQVISLTEKLQEKEVVEDGDARLNKGNLAVAASVGDNVILQVQQKDRISTGSAVVDSEEPRLMDSSGESYFRESYHGECGIRIQPEEEDGSDEGCSYLPIDVFANNHSNNDCWWAWN